MIVINYDASVVIYYTKISSVANYDAGVVKIHL